MKTADDIKREIRLGEDSTRQFKAKLNSAESLAKEVCAMSNSRGGTIYVGVNDQNQVEGLSEKDIHRYNQWIAAVANEHLNPVVDLQTTNVLVDEKAIIVIEVAEGNTKPYHDKSGCYWVKRGSDVRAITQSEMRRFFQQGDQLNIDETPTTQDVFTTKNEVVEWNIDRVKFYTLFERKFQKQVIDAGLPLEQIIENMNLAKEGKLNLAGLLLVGLNVQNVKPAFLIRAVAYAGNEISDDVFIDRRDCIGNIDEQFSSAMTFLRNNLARIQDAPTFNTQGKLEINERALEEAIANALLHRDYSKNAVIRLLVFRDRVEIISPGSLPNHLSVENIKNGNSVMRNPVLSSFGIFMLPYSGLGSGVPRILREHEQTSFNDDRDGQQFTVTLKRVERQ